MLYRRKTRQPSRRSNDIPNSREATMALRLMVSIKTLPGKGDEYLAEALPRAVETRAEPGCEQYDYFRNAEDADSFVLIERWTDEPLWQQHMGVMRARPPRSGTPITEGGARLERYDVE